MSSDIKVLIRKLNKTCRKALEGAAEFCLAQTNFNIEIEHFLFKLLEDPQTDIEVLFKTYDISKQTALKLLQESIDKLKRGNTRTPALSPHIVDLLEEAWVLTSLLLETHTIRSAAILLALLSSEKLRGFVLESCPLLLKIPHGEVKENLTRLIENSEEEALFKKASNGQNPSANEALDHYTINLTQQARDGKIDPIEGREAEIRQLIDILTRRRQNNPILTGEAGVGKTAVVEGFALKIVQGDVPPSLKEVSLHALDLGLLEAGAGIKGEFERRLKSVIDEVKASPKPIILFIDEAHTLIGAGGQSGEMDAANLLKPALARGELRTIAATTWSEYKKYFEKDAALTRRFQVVKVEEPSEEGAVIMLRAIASKLEEHHNVKILDEAIKKAVSLSHRYITGRQLPDKAVSVLDTACARVSLNQTSIPQALESLRKQLTHLETEASVLERESLNGHNHKERLASVKAQQEELSVHSQHLQERWQAENKCVQEILEKEQEISAYLKDAKHPSVSKLQQELITLKKKLKEIQAEEPLVTAAVDEDTVAAVISNWTGIPIRKMVKDEIKTILSLKEKLEARIVGQSQAMDSIARRIWTYRAQLDEPGKPVGVFLLVGPSGVGKTETALALADIFYGGEKNLLTINMSEYQEPHTVSLLKGAPPGYVGYGSGGILTEAVRRNPYSIILLDEIEKAHRDVLELFYQVFDKGTLEDSEGTEIDFKNTIILLTSNVGSEHIFKLCQTPENLPSSDILLTALRPELLKHFQTAFLGRLITIPYYPLRDAQIQKIIQLKLAKIEERFYRNHKARLTYDSSVVEMIAERFKEVESGARVIDAILTQNFLPKLSTQVLDYIVKEEPFSHVHVSLDETSEFQYCFSYEPLEPFNFAQMDSSSQCLMS